MEYLRRKYARDLYLPELQLLSDYGEPIQVGERQTLEIINFVSEVEEPWHHCILLTSRRWNPWLALSEGLWILSGRNDVRPLARFNSRITEFSDDGVHLYGAYGARIRDQLDDCIARLRRDSNDRRAVLSIWRPEDLTAETKDPPCNDMVLFKLRDNKLHMTVINRSNDIHWGLFAVNLPTFSMLQVYIAARLNVGVGYQTHLSNSLHVYTNNPESKRITERMLYQESEDKPVYPSHAKIFTNRDFVHYETNEKFAFACSAALEGSTIVGTVPLFLNFAAEFLRCYERREINPTLITTYPEFADWILAGRIFAEKVWKQHAVERI